MCKWKHERLHEDRELFSVYEPHLFTTFNFCASWMFHRDISVGKYTWLVKEVLLLGSTERHVGKHSRYQLSALVSDQYFIGERQAGNNSLKMWQFYLHHHKPRHLCFQANFKSERNGINALPSSGYCPQLPKIPCLLLSEAKPHPRYS